MATTGQKRSYSDDESSDIEDVDEEALLKIDEAEDLAEELNMASLQLSDEEPDESTEGSTGTTDRGLNLREYQKELADIAIHGENTIIYAATGAGKTRVAFYVVKKHLESNPKGRVAIMADKTFLVNQHFLALKKIMPEYEGKTLCMSGQKEKSGQLHMMIEDFSIVILTPALIENTVRQHEPNFMSKFTLLVFDECHHTQKKTNYMRLMTRYHILKSEDRKPLPQIVGLTATLGTNKANSVEKATEHVLKVMANLDVSKISSVTKNTKEYEQFRKDVKSDKIVLPDSGDSDDVHRSIEKCMRKTEDLFCDSLGDEITNSQAHDDDLDSLATVLKRRGSVKRNDPQYITWTSELSNAAARVLGRYPEMARKVTIGASYLKIYCEVLEVNDKLTSTYAAKTLERKFQTQHLGKYSTSEDSSEIMFSKFATDLVSEITNISEACQSIAGKPVNELVKVLNDYCNENKDKARYIVFVNTRDMSESLTELLKRKGFKCSSFTGSSASSDVGGTSRIDQENVEKEFKEGKIHGIIATNILEEGFDIPDCDFVISYNYVGNEIGTRQAAGRIRKKEGKRVVISKGKEILRESLNIQRGILMDQAMKCILAKHENEIRAFLRDEQNRIVANERIKRKNVAKVPKLETSTFKMKCRRCGKFETNCNTLRSINGHHAVIDPDIWTEISTQPFPKKTPRFDVDIVCQARLFGAGGNKCTHELGTVSTYKGVRLPFLSYKSLVVEDTTTSKTVPLTKWADAPFDIPNLKDPDDLIKMQM